MAKENDKKLATPNAIVGRVAGKTGAIDATGARSPRNSLITATKRH
jgi:hypothetical protein